MKKYINIMIICMFAFMACEVEDKLADALTPSVNSAYVGTWKWTHQQSNSAADCSGDWSDDTSAPIDGEVGWTLNADGSMSDLTGTITVPWTSSGTTGTYFGQDVLTFVEQSDGTWVMWMELAGTDGSGNAVNCNRSGYTKQ